MHTVKLAKGIIPVRTKDGKILVAPVEIWLGCLIDCLPDEAKEILLARVLERVTAVQEHRIVVPT